MPLVFGWHCSTVSPLFQMFLQVDRPWPWLHALFLSGLTRFTLWYNTQDTLHVASRFSWCCYQAELSRLYIAPRECMSHAQDWSRLYKQKDWMQKLFAFINLETFLPDCMKIGGLIHQSLNVAARAEDIVRDNYDALSDSINTEHLMSVPEHEPP